MQTLQRKARTRNARVVYQRRRAPLGRAWADRQTLCLRGIDADSAAGVLPVSDQAGLDAMPLSPTSTSHRRYWSWPACALPKSFDGQSFAGLLADPQPTRLVAQMLLYEYYWEPSFPQTPTMFALRRRQYKLIQYHGIWDTDELYDIVNDPHETRNLIRDPDHTQRTSQMRQQLYATVEGDRRPRHSAGFQTQSRMQTCARASGTQRAEFPCEYDSGLIERNRRFLIRNASNADTFNRSGKFKLDSISTQHPNSSIGVNPDFIGQ